MEAEEEMATLNELEERVRSLEGKVAEMSRQRPPRARRL